jgi:predicted transcriptional regulator
MARRRRRSDRSGRAPLFSPGRPVAAGRDEQRRFWAAIAAGMASEDAAAQAGMSQAVGTRLFRKAGGMPPAMFRPSAKALSGRYLSFAEREEIALLRVQGCSIREVARRLRRTASTISRELRRNAATRSGRPGVSRDDSAMACQAICSPLKAGEACAQRGIADLCGGTIGRRRRRSEWGSCSRPGCALERSPTWTAEASAVGKRLEPGADCSPPIGRLPG